MRLILQQIRYICATMQHQQLCQAVSNKDSQILILNMQQKEGSAAACLFSPQCVRETTVCGFECSFCPVVGLDGECVVSKRFT